MIKREKYLKIIRPFYEQDLIKVITGIRRSGKSVILTQIMEELKESGIKEEQIIYINFEFADYIDITDAKKLNTFIEQKLINKAKYYVFFDEIQNVDKWEKVVNSLKSKYNENISIFITGSNSDLLSGELATHIAGRYVSFKVYPFTFAEACELKDIKDNDKYELERVFDDYIIWGGMPQRFSLKDELQVKTYLSDVYNSIVIKDIIERFKIKDIDLFNKILTFIMTTPSQIFSAESLTKYLCSENIEVSKITIYNYLEYMCRAMLINKAERFDVRGKRILNGKYKYYLTDLGLGQVINNERKKQMGAYIENVVYNELLSRGYDVKVGTLDSGEIDFIATKFNEKIYIQVAYILSDETVIDREFNVYKKIEDNYPKYVLSMDKIDLSQNGIIHKNIIDWLLNK
ncbi:MAG: ATP-binding protein [Tenericutes bacterium]|nr:ATP-binding protein [Mycoplasmatota bacterium]